MGNSAVTFLIQSHLAHLSDSSLPLTHDFNTTTVKGPTQPDPFDIEIGACKVRVTGEPGCDTRLATATPKFQAWAAEIGSDKNFRMTGIHFQSIDFFGKNVGFIKFKADTQAGGKFAPGIVFMRGGAPAILVILKQATDGRLFTVIVKQPRVPVGKSSFAEIPAGMLNADKCFSGVAAKELKEETGIEIHESELINMSRLAWGDDAPGMYPSCGGCDEYIPLFLYRKMVSPEFIQHMQGKRTGVESEFENITVSIIPLDELWKASSDAKALSALCLYDKLIAAGTIQEF